jgi:hypothetical protein
VILRLTAKQRLKMKETVSKQIENYLRIYAIKEKYSRNMNQQDF